MSEDTARQEPSMEEILASIRQIISDDNDDAPAGSQLPGVTAASDRDADVLELTEMMNEDGTVTDLSRGEAAEAAAADAPGASVSPGPAGQEVPAVGKDAASGDDAGAASPTADIVSDAAAGDVARALGGLASAAGSKRPVHLGEGGKTLEALVKEVLKPLLKAWLDENLPPLVERLVEREIQRISGRADD